MKKMTQNIKKHFQGRASKRQFRVYTINFLKHYIIIATFSFLFFFTTKSLLTQLQINLTKIPDSFDLSILFTNLLILPIYIITSLNLIIRRLHDLGISGYYSIFFIFLFLFSASLGFKFGVSAFSILPLPLILSFTILSMINGNSSKNQYGIPTQEEQIN
jgi:uncharacterized membrane protein YhaH (DUF805 family)